MTLIDNQIKDIKKNKTKQNKPSKRPSGKVHKVSSSKRYTILKECKWGEMQIGRDANYKAEICFPSKSVTFF